MKLKKIIEKDNTIMKSSSYDSHSAWKVNIFSFSHNIASYVSEILVLLVVNYRYSAFSSITLFPSHHFARYRQAKNYTFRLSFLKSLRCDFWLSPVNEHMLDQQGRGRQYLFTPQLQWRLILVCTTESLCSSV